MPSPRVLLIGAHGKIAQHLTHLLLTHPTGYHLTSVLRTSAQSPTIQSLLPPSAPGTLSILINDISQIASAKDALPLLHDAKPDYVIFSAGAGGKGGPELTNAIDKEACIALARASKEVGSVRKFVVVSYIGSREKGAPWWGEGDTEKFEKSKEGALKNYYKAKCAADRAVTVLGRGEGMKVVSLRPGSLTDETEGVGRVRVGKVGSSGELYFLSYLFEWLFVLIAVIVVGTIRRVDVARVLLEVLEKVEKSCWLDLLQGEEDVAEAVGRCVSEGVDCVEGEDVEAMVKEWAS